MFQKSPEGILFLLKGDKLEISFFTGLNHPVQESMPSRGM